MAPKGGNAKKESGRAKKAENEVKKARGCKCREGTALSCERKETDKWADGAKANKSKEEREAKRREELARKVENARLLAEEESTAPSKPKAAPKAGAKKAGKSAGKDTKPAGPGAIAAGGLGKEPENEFKEEVESYAATGIDNAIDLLEVVTAKMDKANVGQQAAGIERHPERRFKAAFEAYKEKEMPNLKVEHPGLRLQQYQDLLYKQFQKSPDNPFNQVTVSYDASKDERTQALKGKQEAVASRMRV
ncbi:hypothetical protein BU15DRAFT_78987 [Melanogaster broomeanus]|nr:hypothetical protein BU15DRAFT_78987 [Melanogaster broomeanus]